MEKNYEEWMAKALETEKEEWLKNTMPEHEGQDEHYHTSAPVIIFQMIDQHLQVTNTIHSEFTFSALVLSIKQVTKYGQNYRQSIIEFKEKHFKDRSQVYLRRTFFNFSYDVNACENFRLFSPNICQLDAVLHTTPDNHRE